MDCLPYYMFGAIYYLTSGNFFDFSPDSNTHDFSGMPKSEWYWKDFQEIADFCTV